jgi:hypothetical protein
VLAPVLDENVEVGRENYTSSNDHNIATQVRNVGFGEMRVARHSWYEVGEFNRLGLQIGSEKMGTVDDGGSDTF